MADKANLKQLFNGLHSHLESELGIARQTIGHSGTLGAEAEDRWIAVLRDHLPKRYEVNRAFVIDSRDVCSDQIDIVVHDRQYSPFVLKFGSALYVPAESVYAVLEVKQTMNAQHISYAGDKIASVRKLHRTSLPIKHAGGEYPAKPLHPILGGLVTLDSDWSPPFGESFKNSVLMLTEVERLDIGCVIRQGVFDAKYLCDEQPAIVARKSDASLACFLMKLISLLQDVATAPCIDTLAYAKHID